MQTSTSEGCDSHNGRADHKHCEPGADRDRFLQMSDACTSPIDRAACVADRREATNPYRPPDPPEGFRERREIGGRPAGDQYPSERQSLCHKRGSEPESRSELVRPERGLLQPHARRLKPAHDDPVLEVGDVGGTPRDFLCRTSLRPGMHRSGELGCSALDMNDNLGRAE